MSARCVCGHIKALHRDGACIAVLHPCGCTSYEPPAQADKPSTFPLTDRHYDGIYSKRYTP